jgi:GTPase SAR1 family protein
MGIFSVLRPFGAQTRKLKIGMWGPTQSGKTTYIACLYWHFSKGNNIVMEPINDYAKNYITEIRDDLRKGYLPEITVESSVIYVFHLYRKQQKHRGYIELKVVDAAGSIITDPNRSEPYFKEISDCQGMIIVVDPTQSEDSYLALETLFQHFTSPAKTHLPNLFLAICLSKIDRDDYWIEYDLGGRRDEYVYRKVMAQTFRSRPALERFHNNHQASYIGLSSVGRYFVGGRERSNLTRMANGWAIAQPDSWGPHNLERPIRDILNHYRADHIIF